MKTQRNTTAPAVCSPTGGVQSRVCTAPATTSAPNSAPVFFMADAAPLARLIKEIALAETDIAQPIASHHPTGKFTVVSIDDRNLAHVTQNKGSKRFCVFTNWLKPTSVSRRRKAKA